MKTTLIAVAAALSLLASTSAHAGEGNGEPFPFRTTSTVVAGVPTRDTGSERAPDPASAYVTVAVGTGDILPTSGSEGAVQTSNSLPRGALNATVAYVQAGSVRRDHAQAARPARIALVPGG